MKKFENYCRYLRVLETAKDQDLSNEFVVSGVIDKFFIQFELGWKKASKTATQLSSGPHGYKRTKKEYLNADDGQYNR